MTEKETITSGRGGVERSSVGWAMTILYNNVQSCMAFITTICNVVNCIVVSSGVNDRAAHLTPIQLTMTTIPKFDKHCLLIVSNSLLLSFLYVYHA